MQKTSRSDMQSYSDSTLHIDLKAIAGNYSLLRKKAAGAECAAVVKANAYGLGVAEVAKKLKNSGCRKFFVATIDEAIELRKYVKECEIFVFHGVRPGQEKAFSKCAAIPVLNDFYQIETWNNFASKKTKKLPAVLHIDTGMNRLGLNIADVEKYRPRKFGGINLLYVMSHLACAGEDHGLNDIQLNRFKDICKNFRNVPATLSNSSGIFLGRNFHFDLVRSGIALYGSNPTPSRDNPMHNVVTLTAKILQIRYVGKAQTVGYGATHKVAAGSRLATIPVGYADGYLRHLSNKGVCHIGGIEVPVVGRISMDLVTLDVTKVPEKKLSLDTEVELIGKNVPIDLVAKNADTIGYEILTNLGARYRRKYK